MLFPSWTDRRNNAREEIWTAHIDEPETDVWTMFRTIVRERIKREMELLREQYPALRVFMVTAYDDEQNYQTAQAYGANDYFTKPIDFADLKAKISQL